MTRKEIETLKQEREQCKRRNQKIYQTLGNTQECQQAFARMMEIDAILEKEGIRV